MMPPLPTVAPRTGWLTRLWRRLWQPERNRDAQLGRDLLTAAHLASVLGARSDADEIARQGAYGVAGLLGGPVVVLLPDRSGTLRVRSYEGLTVDITGLTLSPPAGFSPLVRQEPLQLASLLDLGGTLPGHLAEVAGVQGGILVPMVSQGRLLGTVLVGSTRPHWFTPREVGLLTLIAAQMAQALENGRLRIELQERTATVRSMQELTEQLLEHMGAGLVVVDPAMRVTLLNQTARRLLQEMDGRAWEVGDDIGALGGTEQPVRQALIQQPRGLRTVSYREYTVEIEAAPLRGAYGELVGIMALFRDVTRVQRMEQRMRRVERLAAVGEMAAAAAHEIRNPLTSIRGFIQLLQHRKTQQSETYYEIVLREIDRIDGLVRDLLLLAKPIDPKRRLVELVQLVEEMLVLALPGLSARGVEVVRDLRGPLPLLADAHLIRQVLLNLVGNAADAMPGGGTLTVTAGRDGAHVQLWVKDTGHGIAPENLSRLFTPFFTTKETGTGLGLALCYRMVEAHGGRVDVESRVGQGTAFLVELPVQPPVEGE